MSLDPRSNPSQPREDGDVSAGSLPGPKLSFEIGPIRPPSEGRDHSLLIRATRNCPWNRCLFCPVYKGQKFEYRRVEEIKEDVDTVKRLAEELKNMAQIEAPFVTGQLHDSHMVEKFAPSSYGVFATAPYAKDVHEGHDIKNVKGGESYGRNKKNQWFKRAISNLAQ